MNGNLTIGRSKPHDVSLGYKLHDNFSLTINDVRLSDSSTSYHCIVTIDDPQSRNVVYDQLGSITVEVYGKSLLNVPMPYRHVLSICFTKTYIAHNIIFFACCLHVACCDICIAPPSIVIPLEPRVIAVIRDSQPNSTFICEATKVPACTTQISWIHNGRNTSESTDQRFQAYISDTSRTIRSRLNATQLRGRDSGRIDCVARCRVDVPGEEQPLVLTTFRNTTLSILSKCVDRVVALHQHRLIQCLMAKYLHRVI